MFEKKIGSKIKQLRNRLGLSQIELAERIGISFQQIQKYEKGLTRISVMRLKQISDALGISITVFFEEKETPLKVTDVSLKYMPGQDRPEAFHPAGREEIILLKLFRKVKNKKVKDGIIKQLRGIVELEEGKPVRSA